MIIRKRFKAEVAHRVKFAYTERCQGLHGHSYVFEIFIEGKSHSDKSEMLMDFKYLKEKINPFLDAFDHSLLVWEQDRELLDMAPTLNKRYVIVPYNTTAEQVSRHIFYQAKDLGLPITRVIVHETETSYAEFSGDDEILIDLNKVIYSPAINKI